MCNHDGDQRCCGKHGGGHADGVLKIEMPIVKGQKEKVVKIAVKK
jgi:hypothetical protein